MIPQVYYNGQLLPGGANREPNANAMKACMLTKITYPTGGFNEFIFEPHQYSWEGGNATLSNAQTATAEPDGWQHVQHLLRITQATEG